MIELPYAEQRPINGKSNACGIFIALKHFWDISC